ncbi:hypothetical protein D3C72_1143180 [compost metagenome]
MRARVDALEVRQHFFLAAFPHAPFLLFAAVEGDDQVVLLAAAQGVVHQMAMRAGPQHGRVDAQFIGHVVAFDDRAVDDVAGHAGGVAHGAFADHGLHAVRAHHGVRPVAVAVRIHDLDAVAVLRHAGDLGRRAKADQRVLLHGFQDGQVDVGAMDHGVRAAETRAERVARVDAHDLAGIDRVHHDDVVGEDRARARRLADAQGVQCREGVGPQLDAGADFADMRGLLQQLHGDALPGQRQRGRQPADAATDHDDGARGGCGCCRCCRGCIHIKVPCRFIPGRPGRRPGVSVAPARPRWEVRLA